jgi:hypothetical protein
MTRRKSNIQQQNYAGKSGPGKARGDTSKGGRSWDDPNGLGWQVWRRVHPGGVLSGPMQKNVLRLRNRHMIGCSSPAGILLRRWKGYPYAAAGLSMPLFNRPFPFFLTGGARHTPSAPPRLLSRSVDASAMAPPQEFRSALPVSSSGGLLEPFLRPSGSAIHDSNSSAMALARLQFNSSAGGQRQRPPSSPQVPRRFLTAISAGGHAERRQETLVPNYNKGVQHIWQGPDDFGLKVRRLVQAGGGLTGPIQRDNLHGDTLLAKDGRKFVKANHVPLAKGERGPGISSVRSGFSGDFRGILRAPAVATDRSPGDTPPAPPVVSRRQLKGGSGASAGAAATAAVQPHARAPGSDPEGHIQRTSESGQAHLGQLHPSGLNRAADSSTTAGKADKYRNRLPQRADVHTPSAQFAQLPFRKDIPLSGLGPATTEVGLAAPGINAVGPLSGGPKSPLISLARAHGGRLAARSSSGRRDFQILPSGSQVQQIETVARAEHPPHSPWMPGAEHPLANGSGGSRPPMAPPSLQPKNWLVSRPKVMPLKSPRAAVRMTGPLPGTVLNSRTDEPKRAHSPTADVVLEANRISVGPSGRVHLQLGRPIGRPMDRLMTASRDNDPWRGAYLGRLADVSAAIIISPPGRFHRKPPSHVAGSAGEWGPGTGRTADLISVKPAYRTEGDVSMQPSGGFGVFEGTSSRQIRGGSRQESVPSAQAAQRIPFSQGAASIQPAQPASPQVLHPQILQLKREQGRALHTRGRVGAGHMQIWPQVAGFAPPGDQTAGGRSRTVGPNTPKGPLIGSPSRRSADSIRTEYEKSAEKPTPWAPRSGVGFTFPLIACRLAERPAEATRRGRSESDFLTQAHGGYPVFPVPIRDASAGRDSRPNWQAIGPLASLAQVGQAAADSLPILRLQGSRIQGPDKTDTVGRGASDDMPLLDLNGPGNIKRAVSRHGSFSVPVQLAPQASVATGGEGAPTAQAIRPVEVEMAGGQTTAAQRPAAPAELDELVEQIWCKFNRRLTLEQERRGYRR